MVATALPFRARTIPVTAIGDHWSIIVNLLAGSLIGAWVGAEWATRLKSETLYKVMAVLLVIIAGVLLLAHDTTASAPAFTGWMGYRCRIRHRGDRFMTQVRPTNLGHFRALLDWRWRKCARVEGLTISRRYCGWSG